MTRHTTRRVLSSLLAIGALGFAGSAYASGSDGPGPVDKHGHDRTIRLVETSATPQMTVIDLDKPGLSRGDHVVVRDGVARPDGGAPGDLRQDCTVIDVGANLPTSTFECMGSIALPEGTLIIQGPFVPAAPEQAQAVTGGTGQFRAAQGDALVRAEADEITVRLARQI
jgi:hypothetical protein